MPAFTGISRRGFLGALLGGAAVAVAECVVPKIVIPSDRIVTPRLVKDVDEIRALNEAIFDQLANGPPMDQEAMDAINDFTRMKMREDGFYRRIFPPVKISNDELDRAILPPSWTSWKDVA